MKKLIFTLAILAGFAVQALAYDFESVAPTGQTLCYSIISDSIGNDLGDSSQFLAVSGRF